MNQCGPKDFPSIDNQSGILGPPIDAKILLSQCMGSESLALMLITELESSGRDTVQGISQSIREKDYEGAREAAHSLKGAAGIIGALSLRDFAAHLENSGKQRQIGDMEIWTERLRFEMDRCLEFLPQLRQEIASNPRAELPTAGLPTSA